MNTKQFNSTQELARRDGQVHVVNLHPTFKPAKDEHNPTANPYKHLDGLASDYAGPGTSMHKIIDIATLKRDTKINKTLDKNLIQSIQNN